MIRFEVETRRTDGRHEWRRAIKTKKKFLSSQYVRSRIWKNNNFFVRYVTKSVENFCARYSTTATLPENTSQQPSHWAPVERSNTKTKRRETIKNKTEICKQHFAYGCDIVLQWGQRGNGRAIATRKDCIAKFQPTIRHSSTQQKSYHCSLIVYSGTRVINY